MTSVTPIFTQTLHHRAACPATPPVTPAATLLPARTAPAVIPPPTIESSAEQLASACRATTVPGTQYALPAITRAPLAPTRLDVLLAQAPTYAH